MNFGREAEPDRDVVALRSFRGAKGAEAAQCLQRRMPSMNMQNRTRSESRPCLERRMRAHEQHSWRIALGDAS